MPRMLKKSKVMDRKNALLEIYLSRPLKMALEEDSKSTEILSTSKCPKEMADLPALPLLSSLLQLKLKRQLIMKMELNLMEETLKLTCQVTSPHQENMVVKEPIVLEKMERQLQFSVVTSDSVLLRMVLPTSSLNAEKLKL